MAKITKRTVDALKPGELAWDSEVKGFGVRCQRASKVYVVKARIAGRQRWLTIGRHGSPWTVEAARREARRIIGEIAGGKDVAANREADKRRMTFKDLADKFMAEHVEPKRKPRTVEGYRALLDRLVIPALGKLDAGTASRSDVARLHHSLRDTPYQANRTLAVLFKLFSWAERHGRGHQPLPPRREVP